MRASVASTLDQLHGVMTRYIARNTDRKAKLIAQRSPEQVQEQIRFIHQILVALLVMTLGSPFLVEFLRSRRERREQETLKQVRRLFVAMREETVHDERLRHMLESAKLL